MWNVEFVVAVSRLRARIPHSEFQILNCAARRAIAAAAHIVSAHVIGITCTENRPGYAEPRATIAPTIDARKYSTPAAGSSLNSGTPRIARRAAPAPARTGSANTSKRGGSFTVSTISTLSSVRPSDAAIGAPGCQFDSRLRDVP